MIKQTGLTYASAKHAKALFLGEGKLGKSSFLCASALGLLPWQKAGGVVDRPENLHVLTFDSSALAGIAGFLTKTCKAPEPALGFNVYNFQDDARAASLSRGEWDFTLYNSVLAAIQEIKAKTAKGGTHVVLVSSLTGLAAALKRGIAGPVGAGKRGSGMDMAKWEAYATQLSEIRNILQDDAWHVFFEAHVFKQTSGDETHETLMLEGKSGQNFAFNVEQVFRVRRMFGTRHPQTNCDQVYLDTRPNMECVANGRAFNEALEPKEPDLTTALQKLGLRVGNWQATAATAK